MITHRHRTILGDIPKDWSFAPVRDLLAGQFSGDWGADDGEAPISVIRSTNFTESGTLDLRDVATRFFERKKAESFGLLAGDLLVERSGGGPDQPVGRIAFVPQNLPATTVSNFVQVISPNADRVDGGFLGWVLYELQRCGVIERVQQQSTQMRNLNWRAYTRLILPVPPLPEQRRIAGVLKLADEAIAKAQAELDATREVKRSLMATLFVEGIPGRHSQFISSPLGRIPAAWQIRRIREVLACSPAAGTSPQSRPEPPGTPILNVSCVGGGLCDPTLVTYVDVSDTEKELYRAKTGDFFVLRGNGNRDYVATGGLLRVEPPQGTIYSDKLIRLRFKESEVAERFIPFMWESPAFRSRLQSKAESGSGLWMISRRDIVKERFLFPPKDEQEEMVRILESIHESLTALESKLRALRDVKKSLLQNLLTGKIRLREDIAL